MENSVEALLGLRVLDPACGSGHFLLAAARRIASRVARQRGIGVASALDYRRALRDVARQCLYGVDRNPMAVELTKVALWIETIEPGKPLGFLDANIRCGDALIGVFDLEALRQGVPDEAYKPLMGDDRETARHFAARNRAEKSGQGALEFGGGHGRLPPPPPLADAFRALRALPEDSVDEIVEKDRRIRAAEVDPKRWRWRAAADLYVAAFLTPKTGGVPENRNTVTIPTTGQVWAEFSGQQVYGPLIGRAQDLAAEARSFHWPLEFPEASAAGGFDVVLGNPPWERIKLQEQEFFASRDAEIAEAANAAARGRLIAALRTKASETRDRKLYDEFEAAKRLAEAASVFVRIPAEDGGRFPLTGRGDVNTYALFAELFSLLIRQSGRAGIIVPTGIATDATTAPFFGSLIDGHKLAALIDFENRQRLFADIDSRMKFSLLTIGREVAEALFSFFLTDPAQLAEPERRFTLSPAQIAAINPNTKTAPVLRSRADADLTAKIYARSDAIAAADRTHPWQLRVRRFLDMNRTDVMALVTSEPEQDSIAVWEGKLFWQFDHRHATYRTRDATPELISSAEKYSLTTEPKPRYWINRSEFVERLAEAGWKHDWLIGFRDFTNATNERTIIGAAFPLSGTDYTIRTLLAPNHVSAIAFLGIANTIVFDFVARNKLVDRT